MALFLCLLSTSWRVWWGGTGPQSVAPQEPDGLQLVCFWTQRPWPTKAGDGRHGHPDSHLPSRISRWCVVTCLRDVVRGLDATVRGRLGVPTSLLRACWCGGADGAFGAGHGVLHMLLYAVG